MRTILPAMRVSLGLIMAVVTIILLSDILGFIPDRATAVIDGRKNIAETLAVQFSLATRRNDFDAIESSMKMLVERNDDVLSTALRNAAGNLVVTVGNHAEHWDSSLGEMSTPTRIHVPIYRNAITKQKWGSFELRFTPTSKTNVLGMSISPLVLMTVFIAITGFLVFLVMIKKIFTHIDPSAVVPARVRKALDTLTEGVLLVDKKGRALFANKAFSNVVGIQESQIIGKRAGDLGWKSEHGELPWTKTLTSGVSAVGEKIELAGSESSNTQFVVNSSPVLDSKGKQQGVMVTFDDVTELEDRNDKLQNMVSKLESSSDQINRQNEELRVLATRDQLTDCLNRRSLFDQFEARCLEAVDNNTELSCLMLDIDFFKRVNDTYGHVAGDAVLRVVAAAVKSVLRGDDQVFRYGGEEFCLLLPETDIESASRLAERVRETVEAQVIDDAVEDQVIRVTCSIGLSSIRLGAENLQALIETADAALYESKGNGRNRVTTWSVDVAEAELTTDARQANADDKSVTGADAAPSTGEHLAIDIDNVTGLPNRVIFRRKLAEAIIDAQQHNKYIAVLILDLDMFQRVNNVFGYSAGDTVLDTVAKRLSNTVRAGDSALRLGDGVPEKEVYGLGGDEFAILLTCHDSQNDVSAIVDRLIDTLSSPVTVDDQEVFLTCSVGVSQFPIDGMDADTLLNCASVALKQAKRDGKNTCQFFRNDLVCIIRDDYETEKALRLALDNNEFELYFQPQLDIQTMSIESMEALIRWHHPQRGIIMPGEFIQAAEASGQITAIGQWVINAACQQIRSWLDAGIEMTVAVNLSPVQVRQEDLVEQINAAVSSARISPKLLQLEITENMIMEHLDSTPETMRALDSLGYKISIDDFGTGYSSLEYLKRFPVDSLKIDRTFINGIDTDPDNAAIVRAAISMAHSMGLKVVAEGVETEEQLLYLHKLRCDLIQGYLLGRPLPAKDAIALLDEKQWQGMAS